MPTNSANVSKMGCFAAQNATVGILVVRTMRISLSVLIASNVDISSWDSDCKLVLLVCKLTLPVCKLTLGDKAGTTSLHNGAASL